MTTRDGKMTDTAISIVVVLVIFAVALAAALGAEKGVYFFQRERDCSGAPSR